MNTYQPIIHLGEFCRHHGVNGVFDAVIFYTCILPVLIKDEKEYKNNNKYIATLWLIVFAITVIAIYIRFRF